MENFYLAVVTTGSIFAALYCLILMLRLRGRAIFHKMVISAVLVFLKLGEFIFCIILDKNFTSAVILGILYLLMFVLNILEFKFDEKKEEKKDD